MNFSFLDELCKTCAHIAYKDVKRVFMNLPFVSISNKEGIIRNCIEFEIKQVFGRSVLKKYTAVYPLDNTNQIKIAMAHIEKYQAIIEQYFIKFTKKHVL